MATEVNSALHLEVLTQSSKFNLLSSQLHPILPDSTPKSAAFRGSSTLRKKGYSKEETSTHRVSTGGWVLLDEIAE